MYWGAFKTHNLKNDVTHKHHKVHNVTYTTILYIYLYELRTPSGILRYFRCNDSHQNLIL